MSYWKGESTGSHTAPWLESPQPFGLLPAQAGPCHWGKLTCKDCGDVSMHSGDEGLCDACERREAERFL